MISRLPQTGAHFNWDNVFRSKVRVLKAFISGEIYGCDLHDHFSEEPEKEGYVTMLIKECKVKGARSRAKIWINKKGK